MTPDQRQQRVEDACADLLRTRTPITFDAIAAHTGLGRATLYRNPELRAVIEDHRSRGRGATPLPDSSPRSPTSEPPWTNSPSKSAATRRNSAASAANTAPADHATRNRNLNTMD